MQMRDSYGNAARHFTRTQRWMPAPNKTTPPHEHIAVK
jgi:hypothetical protein